MTDRTTVCIVTDDSATAERLGRQLDEGTEVRQAIDRETALDRIDDDVDVILLDRQTSAITGVDLLATVRQRGINCRAAVISSTAPDRDVIDHGFDTALVTPVAAEVLNDTVDTLRRRTEYDELLEEITALQYHRAELEHQHSGEDLTDNEEYRSLTEQFDELRTRLDAIGDDMGEEAISTALHTLSDRSRHPSESEVR